MQEMHGEEFEADPIHRREAHAGMHSGHPGMQRGGHPGMEKGPHTGKRRMGKMGKQRMGKHVPGQNGMPGQMGMGEDYDDMEDQTQAPVDNSLMSNHEIGLILFLLLFILNMFIGKSRNYKFAKAWYFANKEYLFNSYSHIGVITDKKNEAIALMKETYSTYKIYASGRVNCKWMMCSLEVFL